MDDDAESPATEENAAALDPRSGVAGSATGETSPTSADETATVSDNKMALLLV